MQYTSHSPADTDKLAQQLAAKLKPGSVLALYGDLGSGKTTFTQYLGSALGISKRLTSPTFIIMRSYPLPQDGGELHHLDLYRISSLEDIKSFDLQELMENNSHIIVIEWPQKIEGLLPPHTIRIFFKTSGENTRNITVEF